jgi:hypothetical protein
MLDHIKAMREQAQQDGTLFVARLHQLDEERTRVQADIHRLEGRVQVLSELELEADPDADGFEIEPDVTSQPAQFHTIPDTAVAGGELPKEQ